MATDIVIIGGGPGGYVSAIRAAQLGASVTLIEAHKLGGICNNFGCIPSKTLIHLAETVTKTNFTAQFGIVLEQKPINVEKLVAKRNELLDKLANGIGTLLKLNKVELIMGRAELIGNKKILITKADGSSETREAKNIIIATGGSASKPQAFASDPNVLTGEEFLVANDLPTRPLLVGAGPEGVEFAFLLAALGMKVTVVEALDSALSFEDEDVRSAIERIMGEKGIRLITGTKLLSIENKGSVSVATLSNSEKIEADKILFCAGRRLNTSGLGLEKEGITLGDRNKIVVNDKMQTNVPGIYAIGDVTGGRYAHEAIQQGMVAVENAMGMQATMTGQVIPGCVYSIPEVASIGMTEAQAREQHEILVGKFSMKASGRAMTIGETSGFMKVILDKTTHRFLGIHIVTEHASDMIGEAVLALRYLTAEQVIDTIHPHPTLIEALREATMDAFGRAIHQMHKEHVTLKT